MEEEVKNKETVDTPATGVEPSASPEDEVQAKDGNGAPVLEKMPRELFYERIRASRPDGKYDEDEQEVYRQAGQVMDELELSGKRGKELQDKLMRRFAEDPEEAQALLDYLDGMPLVAAIRKYKGDEALTMQEGQDGWDEWQKAGEERKRRYKEQDDLIKEIRENGAASAKEFEEFAEDLKLNEEQKQAIWNLIQDDLNNMTKGKISKDVFRRYSDALNHDSDVEGAKRQGEIEGKNKAIEAKRAKMDGSGLPNGSAGGNASEEISTPSDTEAWLGGRQWKK